MEPSPLLERIVNLIQSTNLCVFATVSDQRPRCSLMAYLSNEDGSEIYMLTGKDSHKYRNLQQNRSVSLLIDNRGETAREKTLALTVSGQYEPRIDDEKRRWALDRLLSAYPHLNGLADTPDMEVVCIRVESFLLLEGPTQSHYVEL